MAYVNVDVSPALYKIKRSSWLNQIGFFPVRDLRSFKTLALWGLMGAVLSLWGCSKPMDKAKTSDKPPATVAPLGYAMSTAEAQVTLTLPETLKVYPELHSRLYSEGEQDLKTFMQRAQKDHQDLKAQGFLQAPYFKTIKWFVSARSKRLVSAYAVIDTDSGGAHPNSEFQNVIWDVETSSVLSNDKLFDSHQDLKPLDDYLCHALEAERSHRSGSVQQQGNCPKILNARLVLINAEDGPSIGAVEALFAPYEVGAFAEGAYDIRIPQSVIRPYIQAPYQAEFAGAAPSVGGVIEPKP